MFKKIAKLIAREIKTECVDLDEIVFLRNYLTIREKNTSYQLKQHIKTENTLREEVNYWRNKYLELLEKGEK